jgi:hypothetical protein
MYGHTELHFSLFNKYLKKCSRLSKYIYAFLSNVSTGEYCASEWYQDILRIFYSLTAFQPFSEFNSGESKTCI